MRRHLAVLAAILVLGLVVYALYTAVNKVGVPQAGPEGCTARVDGRIVYLSTSQAESAALIAAVALRRGLPARAVSIALTTAYQESDLENVRYGDSDSLGLFQQRPSEGWGRPRQIMNPYYATNAFYDALVRIPGYQTLDITHVAQQVQRSAYPSAYTIHEQDGRDLASALTGYSPASFSCEVDSQHLARQPTGPSGLTARAAAVRSAITTAYGDLPLGGFGPGSTPPPQVGGRHSEQGLGFDVFFRPVTIASATRGWALAHYLVANAVRLHVQHVVFDGRTWTAGPESIDGWRHYTPPGPGPTGHESATSQATREARDHVHVEVWR